MDYDQVSNRQESSENLETKPERRYYYAEVIRPLFAAGGIILLLSYPLFSNVVSGAFIFVLMGIIIIILAGITNRRLKTIFFLNAIVSLFVVIALEFLARSLTFSDHPFLVVLNQIIALIFVVTLYYCLRTLRGFLFK